MKTFNTVLSLLLLIAVVVLSIKVYSGENEHGKKEVQPVAQTSDDFASAKIAYVRTDTMVSKYKLYEELAKTFEQRAMKVDAQIKGMENAFQENYQIFLEQRNKLSPEQLQAAQMDLQANQQQAMQQSEALALQLKEEEAEMMGGIMEDVKEVMEELRKELGVDFILSKTAGGNIISANETLDITQMAIDRLNAQYEKEQKEADQENAP